MNCFRVRNLWNQDQLYSCKVLGNTANNENSLDKFCNISTQSPLRMLKELCMQSIRARSFLRVNTQKGGTNFLSLREGNKGILEEI